MTGARRPARPRWTRLVLLAVPLAVPLLATGCDRRGGAVRWSFERMIRQPSLRAYEGSTYFSDSAAMRRPPDGTVSRTATVADAAVVTGRAGEDTVVAAARTPVPDAQRRRLAPFVEEIPVRLTADDVGRGRDRFEIFCAPCHGIDGSGGTPVGRAMQLQPPPSLHSERIRTAPAGHIYAVIAGGFGLMPSYAGKLDIRERWAVVAYVRALQLSRRAPLDQLPDSVQRAFRREAP